MRFENRKINLAILFIFSILSATELQCGFRSIKILPFSQQKPSVSDDDKTRAEMPAERGKEFGINHIFEDVQVENQPKQHTGTTLEPNTAAAAAAAASSEAPRTFNKKAEFESILLEQLKLSYEQRGSGPNPLVVQFRFKNRDNGYSPFIIYCGVFISGSETQRETMDLPFDVEASANTRMTQLKLSPAESQAWDTIKQCLINRSEQGQKGKICCKYPHIEITGQRFCSGSLRDIYELAKEGGILVPEEHQSFVKSNLGLSTEGNCRTRLGEVCGNPDCFTDDFTGNFYDSEQAWLKFVSSSTPSLKYVRFIGRHDGNPATEIEISLISFLDICRYCRGTLSMLLSRETETLFFHHFLYRNLPAALLTRMKHKECTEQELQGLCSNLQNLGQVCGFSSKIPAYIGELQKIRDTIQFLSKFKVESNLQEIKSIGDVLKKLKSMYDGEVEGLVRSGFYDGSIGLLLMSIYAYSFQQIPSRRA